MAKRSKDNYIPVHVRLAKFRKENPKGSIKTEYEMLSSGEDYAVIFSAQVVSEDGAVLGEGSSLTNLEGEDKEFEKGETSAIGRALAMAGYEAEGGIASEEEIEESESIRKGKKRGFGSRKKAKKEDAEDEEEDTEEDDEEEPSSKKSKKKLTSRLKARAKKEDEEEDDEEDAEEDEDEEEPPKKKSSSRGKSILDRYGIGA